MQVWVITVLRLAKDSLHFLSYYLPIPSAPVCFSLRAPLLASLEEIQVIL